MAGRGKIFSSPIFWFLFGFSLCILACSSGKDAHIGLACSRLSVVGDGGKGRAREKKNKKNEGGLRRGREGESL